MSRCINNMWALAHHCTPITFEADKDSILNSKAEMKTVALHLKWNDWISTEMNSSFKITSADFAGLVQEIVLSRTILVKTRK